ncbi:MAG: Phosphoenolpyruvate-protein phosphotransferase of system [Polyangiaceae bacterium]|jgi:phosphotransferase system enzyme I (PtsI)|nr:Phosphoenolpyruvate-protein phosphotransferase of system [Polyangiaceae bacterium]
MSEGEGHKETRAEIALSGLPGSPGVALGKAAVLNLGRTGVIHRHVQASEVPEEIERFKRGVAHSAAELRELSAKAQKTATKIEISVLEAYTLMVEDELLLADVSKRVETELICAEWALDLAVTEMAATLRRSGDAYLAERSHDFEFVGARIRQAIGGGPADVVVDTSEPRILVAHDLSPAETVGLTRDKVLALVTEVGTRTSHTAIVARALEIPAVVGVAGALSRIGNGDSLIVDGLRGQLLLHPRAETTSEYQTRAARFRDIQRLRREARDRPSKLGSGELIELRANIEIPSEALAALSHGARGIGLYRTEFLYVDRTEPPTEEEQYDTYRRVAEIMNPLSVTLRTFDIGGDKFVSVFQMPSEMNPALGLRAVRLGLARPEIFMTQLRAMIRATAHGKLRIMLPMIASLGELFAVKELYEQALSDVDRRGLPRAEHISLGIMVEVPSAAVLAHEFAEHAEFMSIGTNDLVQYTLAVDRSTPELAYLASYFDPAILRLIQNVIAAGKAKNRPVLLCGAMASDPMAALLLVGMGLREMSMEAAAVPEVREVLANVTLDQVERAAADALVERTAAGVTAALTRHFGRLLSEG